MEWAKILMILLSLGLCLGFTLLSYRNSNVRGGNYFAYINLLLALWLGMELMKTLFPEDADSWRRGLAFFGWLPLSITGFALANVSENLGKGRRFLWTAAWVVAGLSVGLWLYDYLFAPLASPFKSEAPWYHLLTGGAAFYSVTGLSLMFLQYLKETGMARKQMRTFLVAGFALMAGVGMQFSLPEKWTAYELHLGGVVLYSFALIWGHFRYGLFGLLPVSREALLESLNEGVVVFNSEGWIIDVNSTAFKYLGAGQSLLGRRADDIVVRELGLSPEAMRQSVFSTEVQAGEGRWLHVQISPAEGGAFSAYQSDPGFDILRKSAGILYPGSQTAPPPIRVLTIYDISTVKQAMEALHRSDQRLSLYVRRSPLPYIELDVQHRITEWNAAAERLFGQSKAEVLGRDIDAVLKFENDDLWPPHHAEIGPVLRKVRNPNGTYVYGEFYSTTLFDAEGRLVGTAAMVLDVTRERRARAELKQKSAELESVFSALPDVFLRLQYDGTLKDFRAGRDLPASWRAMLDEMVGRDVLFRPDCAPQPLRTVLFEYWPQIRKIMRDLEVLHLPKTLTIEREMDGEIYAFEARFIPADAGECIVVVRNVSEEWQTRRALALSESQYRAVVEDQSEFICRYTPDFKLTFTNEAFCQHYARCPKDELHGVNFEVLLPAAGREAFRQAVHGFSPQNPNCEQIYATPTDKGLQWILWKHRAIYNANGAVVEYQSVGRDITERKQAQDELEHKNKVLAVYGAIFERLHYLHKGQSSSALGSEDHLKLISEAYLQTVCEAMGFGVGIVGTWRGREFEPFATYGTAISFEVTNPEVFLSRKPLRGENGPLARMQSFAAAPIAGMNDGYFVMGAYAPRPWRYGEYEAEMASLMADSIGSLLTLHHIERRRTQAEIALKESELRFRTLATQTPDLILIYDAKLSRPVYVNRYRFLEYDSENGDFLTIFGKKAVEHAEWEHLMEHAAAFPESYAEVRILNARGAEEWIQVRTRALPRHNDPDRNVIFTFSVVTAFKRQQEAMLLHSSLLEQITTPVFALNPKAEVTFWNPPAQELTLWSKDEILGKTVHELLFYREEIAKINRAIEAVERHERWDGELTLRRKDGTPRALLFNLSAIRDGDGAIFGYIAVFMDVSERKKAEIALMEAKEAAEAATRAKSDFLATVSHEIRTPMNGVIGMTHLLRQTALSPDQADLVETIRISGERLLALLNDILDFSKIESGKMELESRGFYLKKAVQSAVELFSAEAARKKLFLKTVYSETLPEIVVGDDARLQQIIINLVSNALKFTEKGGVMVRVDGKTEGGKVHLEFAVEDTGVGIPKEKQDRLFKPFSQVDASHTRRFGGTGLGLAICTRLVQLMGGKIRLDSDYTKGARFVFQIAFEIGSRMVHGPSQAYEFDPALAQKYPLRILVAEDNLINQKMIRMVLNRMGYQPVMVENGIHAVEAARQTSFDLIFMDVQMPEMDGITATREILKSGIIKPVIVAMTANAMSSDKDDCLAAGMSGFISKPIRIEQVHEALVMFGSRIPAKHLN
jgi:PAS domain S-box-containing protein